MRLAPAIKKKILNRARVKYCRLASVHLVTITYTITIIQVLPQLASSLPSEQSCLPLHRSNIEKVQSPLSQGNPSSHSTHMQESIESDV